MPCLQEKRDILTLHVIQIQSQEVTMWRPIAVVGKIYQGNRYILMDNHFSRKGQNCNPTEYLNLARVGVRMVFT